MIKNQNSDNKITEQNKSTMRYQSTIFATISSAVATTDAFTLGKSPIAVKHHITDIEDLALHKHQRVHDYHLSSLQYKSDIDTEHTPIDGPLLNGYSTNQNNYVPIDEVVSSTILATPKPLPGDCDVKKFISEHATFFYDEPTFLVGPTPRTQKALDKFNELLAKERDAGGVLSVDTETPSTITSHDPGYLLSKEEDVIVGLQAEEPLKRTCKPQ